MYFFTICDFRHRQIPSIAIRLHANTRSRPPQYRLQASVEPRIARPVVSVSNDPQIVMRHSNGTQIVPRELAQHLPVRYPDNREVARAIERELHGTFLRGAEDSGPVGLGELGR